MSKLSQLETLRARIRGAVMTSVDEGFDRSREIWNRLHDSAPAVIVRPAASDDVAIAEGFVRYLGREMAIKGGGHHAGGYAATRGGLLLDMAGLRTIEVN